MSLSKLIGIWFPVIVYRPETKKNTENTNMVLAAQYSILLISQGVFIRFFISFYIIDVVLNIIKLLLNKSFLEYWL